MTQQANIESINKLSIASLALSIAVVLLGPFGSIPGIICGHIALKDYKRAGITTGTGMAKAGLWIGYIGLALCILSIIFAFVVFMRMETIQADMLEHTM